MSFEKFLISTNVVGEREALHNAKRHLIATCPKLIGSSSRSYPGLSLYW